MQTKHHIVPTSRGGKSVWQNVVEVPEKQHQLFHQLFGNRTPEEIVQYLEATFFKGFKVSITDQRQKNPVYEGEV